MKTVLRLALLCAVVLLAAPIGAEAQQNPPQSVVVTTVQLGVRQPGQVYALALAAQNVNCTDPMDFRFNSSAAWLQLPADPVVRGLATGQQRELQARIDTNGLQPGRYQATVEVECENCGWFIFKNCSIDKQQINFVMDIALSPPPGQAPEALPDPNDPAIPEAERNKLKAALAARDKANAGKASCEEDLERLRAEAAAAQEKANKAAQDAKDAAAKAAEAEAEYKKAREKADAAEAEKAAWKAHYEDAIRRLGLNDPETLKAKAELDAAEAEAAKESAAAAKADAAARAAKAAAAKAAKEAEAAAAAAKAAAEKLAKKEKECEGPRAAAAAAEGDVKRTAEDADKAKRKGCPVDPPVAAANPDKEIAEQEERVRACKERYERETMLQAQALKALRTLGALKGMTSKQDQQVKTFTETVVETLLEMFGVCYNVNSFSTVVGGAQAGAAMIPIRQGQLTPGNPAHAGHEDETKKWLVKQGFAKTSAEAEAVYRYMDEYNTNGRSTDQWDKQNARTKEECAKEQAKLDASKAKKK